MLRPDGVKEKRYCGFHDRNSHSINDCRVFRMNPKGYSGRPFEI
jgi:hypothetical protein